MGKPSAPPPPDYAAAAKAQGEANVHSSLATNYMNQVNQVGPTGSITYNRSATDGYTLPDGTFIPNTTVTTTLSPEQQKLYDQNVGISTQLNDLAAKGIGYVDQASSTPVNLESLPAMSTGVTPAAYKSAAAKGNLNLETLGATPTYSTLTDKPTYNSVGFNQMQSGPAMDRVGTGPEYTQRGDGPAYNEMSTGPAYKQMDDGASFNRMDDGASFNRMGEGPTFNRMGDGPTFNRMGEGPTFSRMGQVGNIQTGVEGTNYQDHYDFSGVSQLPKYEDFSSQRDKITDAMMQRLQPYIDRDREALRTQLVNQGVGQGTEAYGWDMDMFQRGVNDQRIAALLAGGQEQQNLFNNAMGLRQQGVQEAFAQGNLKNSVADAVFNQRLAQGNFANTAQAQQFGQQGQITSYNNDQAAREEAARREALGYNNDQAAREEAARREALGYNNSLQSQEEIARREALGYNNSLQSQEETARREALGYNNSLQSREEAARREALGYNNSLADKTFANQNQALTYNNDLASRAYADRNQTAEYNNTLADKSYQNSTAATAYNNDAAAREAAMAREALAYNNDNAFKTTGYNNELAAKGFADSQTLAGFNNDVASKSLADSVTKASVNNQAQQQEYAQNQQDLLNYNQAQEAQFNQGLASGQFANQARAQALQEQDYARNAPLNMLNALRQGNQVQMPQFINAATGTQIQPAPIYNATADGYNAQMAKYNADLQSRGGFLSGLASLGSAAILASDRRLKTNISLIGQRPDGLNLYSYDYIWGQPAVGVMADEVAVLRPEALGPVVGGYATVYYGAL